MRVFIAVIALIFSLQSWTKADDISDLEIEGMSIGDSALNYFSEVEINNGVQDYYKNKKFTDSEIIGLPQFKEYQSIHINFKTNDNNYVIYALEGTILFKENIKDCYKKKDEIVKEVSKILTSAKKKDAGTNEHSYDKSGESITTDVWFYLKSGIVSVSCYDWSTKMGFADHLRIRILSEEFDKFLTNDAY